MDSNAEWHNESKGVMMINTYYKDDLGLSEEVEEQMEAQDPIALLDDEQLSDTNSEFEEDEEDQRILAGQNQSAAAKKKRKKTEKRIPFLLLLLPRIRINRKRSRFRSILQ